MKKLLTEQEIKDFILLHYRKDMTATQIGRYVGLTKNSVISKYHRIVGNKKGDNYYPTGEYKFNNRFKGKFCL